MTYFLKRTSSVHEAFYFMKNDKILPEILVFFLIFLRTHPKLCKGLVWQNFKENTTEGEPSFSALSLALRSSHIFLQIFSINNLCGNRNLYFLFNLRAHVDNFVENTVSNDLCRILTIRKELKLP